jgi:FkbM family methyltransferase
MRPLMAATGDWEVNEGFIFRAHLRRGATVVDVGAHVGYYTVMAARAVGRRGRVFAVEPDPDNAALLLENVRRSGLRNVRVIRAAAWRETTRVRLLRDRVNTGDNRVVPAADADRADNCLVDAVAMDERLERESVSVMKIDAQGTDHVALEGMRETLARCRPVVFVEFWPAGIREAGFEPESAVELYRELGYRITMIGYDADFATWSSEQIVTAAEGFPFGAVALVLRPL